jgi:glycosyltransferase involved in cell wall biosynthesis
MKSMRVLLVHNKYQQSGGEDGVFNQEGDLLEAAGFEVRRLIVSNDEIASTFDKFRTVAYLAGSPRGVRRVGEALDRHRPDIVHVHNVFPLLTPAIFAACRARGLPVVHTLHNYRVVCANGMLLRDGHVCEDCLTHGPWQAVKHRCYRDSAVGSAAVARAIHLHQRRGVWMHDVDRFIALSQFARAFFTRAGLPERKIAVKPNSTPDPGRPDVRRARDGFLFVGRLSREKGVDTLLSAFAGLDIPLTIVGDGPERMRLQAAAGPNIHFAGALPKAAVSAHMARARALVAPSIWYEGFPLVIAEAYAHGLPVIASRIGALAEIVEPGRTGQLVAPADSAALAAAVRELHARPDAAAALGAGARAAYEASYSPAVTVQRLGEIYQAAQRERHSGHAGDASESVTARW